jgi:ATP-dependent DNA ligase
VVGGFTEPRGKRVGLGALLVGYFDGDDFVFAGKVGTGFDGKLLRALRARLDALEIPARPFTRGTGDHAPAESSILPFHRQWWLAGLEDGEMSGPPSV